MKTSSKISKLISSSSNDKLNRNLNGLVKDKKLSSKEVTSIAKGLFSHMKGLGVSKLNSRELSLKGSLAFRNLSTRVKPTILAFMKEKGKIKIKMVGGVKEVKFVF